MTAPHGNCAPTCGFGLALSIVQAWPCTWIVHADREELEIMRPGVASVMYRPGAQVPLGESLCKYGLSSVPATALFDEDEFARYCDG